jgi:hypothetical protein
METDTDANVFVAYLFEDSTDDFRTTGWCQADWRSRWCNDHLYFEVSPHFIKRQSLIDDFYNTLFVSSRWISVDLLMGPHSAIHHSSCHWRLVARFVTLSSSTTATVRISSSNIWKYVIYSANHVSPYWTPAIQCCHQSQYGMSNQLPWQFRKRL